MNITIVDGHPDPAPHLNHALADRYAAAAQEAGHTVRRIEVAKLEFPLMRDPRDFYQGEAPEVISSTQIDLAWADHIAVFFPLWMSDVPSLLKAYLEQTLRPGFAIDYGGGPFGFPKPLLRGKSLRIVVTMGMPAPMYRMLMGAHAVRLLKRLFGFAGIAPVYATMIGSVGEAKDAQAKRWFKRMERLARRDGSLHERRLSIAGATIAAAGAIAGAAYLAYALSTWARYGSASGTKEPDALLDRFMQNFEVRLTHATLVHAPARVTFSAIRLSDFERSPIVRFLLAARGLVMRAKPELHEPAALPFEKLTSLGWGVLSIEAGKEIVLGTVTKPWEANTRFRPLPADEFESFHEPGYAKIALSLRVDEVSSEHCELRTETRVQTTDPVSRARFRRYWALLSPGMAIIRRALLAQVKGEAEAAWTTQRV